MPEFLTNLFLTKQFIPHGHCYLWKPGLVGLHIASDLLIALAYYSIPIMLVYFVRKRRDVPFDWIFLLFGIFIVACGTNHVMEVWTLWYPTYWLSGLLKAITAVVSLYTASSLLPLIPQALALPSPAELEAKNLQLAQEISIRMAAEVALLESQQMLQLVMDNIPQLIFWKDKNSVYLGCNQNFAHVAGFGSREEIVGKTDFDLPWKKEESDFFCQCDARVMETDLPEYHIIEPQLQADGKQFWKDMNKIPLHDVKGNVVGILGTVEDITQRKLAEEILQTAYGELERRVESRTVELSNANSQLRKEIAERQQTESELEYSSERFRQLAENIKEVFWMTNFERTQILYISPAYEEIWGRTCNSLYTDPMTWIESLHPLDRNRILETTQPPQLNEGYNEEYRIVRPDGSVRWIKDRAFPIRNQLGDIYRLTGIAEDITERKWAEAEIYNALAREKELSQLKSHFISMASHEFRTPLTTILTFSELLDQYSHKWSEEKKKEYLQRIQTAVKHMTRLLNDVLVLNQVESGKLELNPAPLNLEKFCRHLVEELQLGLDAQYSINFCIHGSCPDLVSLDEKLLQQIFTNLLSNAVKYSPQSGDIQFELSCQDREVVFLVKDLGIGIPPQDQQHLFEPFHRAKNVSKIPGTGLGLSIVKKCVELHNGQIRFNSQVGVGTTFIVILPLHRGLSHDKDFGY